MIVIGVNDSLKIILIYPMGLLVGEYRIVIEIYFTTGYCDNAVERTLYVGMSDQTQSQ